MKDRVSQILALLTLAPILLSALYAQNPHPARPSAMPLGSVTHAQSIACKSGGLTGATCQQLTVSCPNVPDFTAYVKINTPANPLGTVLYTVGTGGSGLYDTGFTYGKTAVENVFDAGFTTVQITFGAPFTSKQSSGWVEGPGGVLAVSCRYATIAQWVYSSVQNNASKPLCATANSGGAGVLAYALSQYGSGDIISMAEVTSGPPTARLDWGCMCKQGKVATTCGQGNLGTCFGKVDGGIWDPAYTPNKYCSQATQGNPPPGGSTFFYDDSAMAPGASFNFPTTYVNVVFGGLDTSSAVPIGLQWYDAITSNKSQVCVPDGPHALPDVLDGATQIANDLISMCKVQ
jgi:hypothetical protein